MANKSHFGVEQNQHGRVADPEVFNKTSLLLFYLGLVDMLQVIFLFQFILILTGYFFSH